MFEDQRTIALIAGNILTGRMPFGGGGKEADVKAVAWAVGLARLIVHEVDATEPLPTRTR